MGKDLGEGFLSNLILSTDSCKTDGELLHSLHLQLLMVKRVGGQMFPGTLETGRVIQASSDGGGGAPTWNDMVLGDGHAMSVFAFLLDLG
jgi:hypothetical protein